jgi:3-methyl-2-oxobutanoate hydroxymethyltransferase
MPPSADAGAVGKLRQMIARVTAPSVYAMKEKGQRVVCVTAYDAVTGAIADESGADVVLVGDSVGNVLLGFPSTLQVTLEQMIHHTAATARGVSRALVVADMPFGSFQPSEAHAVESAVALVRAGAQAVKLEGGYVEAVEAISRTGIPVMGHLGMTPQSVNRFGGHRVQGKGASGKRILEEAAALDAAGVFSVVLELVPATLACAITAKVHCPTIGIGAGPDCDGQVQVFHDAVGLSQVHFKHAKRYAEGYRLFVEALQGYAKEVRDGTFPSSEHSF